MYRSHNGKTDHRDKGFAGIVFLIAVLLVPVLASGGTLDAPTGPTTQADRHTMKHVYDLLKTGTETTKISGTFSGPPAGPISVTLPTTPSGNTLNDIYDASPKPDATNGAAASQVCNTKTYWSLLSGGNWGLKTGSRDCNHRPVAVDDTLTVAENSSLSNQNVISNDSDPDAGTTLTIPGDPDTTGTIGTVTKNGDFTFNYSPGSNFNYLAAGESAKTSFKYTISDGSGGTDTATVVITITGINNSPTASDSSISTSEDTVGAGAFNVTDVDTDVSTLSYSIASGPTNGTATMISSANAFIYTPNADYNGSDAFTFRPCPACATATVNITVNAVNDPPSFDLASPRDQRTAAGSGTVNVNNFAANISKGPADESTQTLTFTVIVVSDPSSILTGTPAINTGTGRLSYTVHATNTGTAQLSVTLTDDGAGSNASGAQLFTITTF